MVGDNDDNGDNGEENGNAAAVITCNTSLIINAPSVTLYT